MSSSDGHGSIAKAASAYLSEGYEENEVIELLVDDGFDPASAKTCVAMAEETDGPRKPWGFEAEDSRGEIANNFDLGIDGVAGADQTGAIEEAQAMLDASHPGQYTVTRVFVL